MSAPTRETPTFTADDEATLRQNHVPAPAFAGLYGSDNPCRSCGAPWPCPTLRAVNRLRVVEATNRRMALGMARMTARLGDILRRLGGEAP